MIFRLKPHGFTQKVQQKPESSGYKIKNDATLQDIFGDRFYVRNSPMINGLFT